MSKSVVIFGAGITGLSAARELGRRGYRVKVLEASDRIGGLAKTFHDPDGFTYDNGPRFIFSTLAEKLGISHICEPVQYYEYMHVNKRLYQFPFGFIKNPGFCFSIGSAMLTRSIKSRPTNLQEFLYTYYGKSFSQKVLQPLIEKWAGLPAIDVSIDFSSRLLPTNLSYIFYSLIKKLRKGITEDYYKKERYIVYPRGSNSQIFEALTRENNFEILLDHPIERILTHDNEVSAVLSKDREVRADLFLSTIPISKLASALDLKETRFWSNFIYRSIRILFIKVNLPQCIEGLWHWFPEKSYPFYRIAEYKNARPELAPPDKTLISIEMALDPSDPKLVCTDSELLEILLPYLQDLYDLQEKDVLSVFSHTSEAAYPILSKASESDQRRLEHRTPLKNLFIAGRTGMFQYKMTEGCYDSAISCVDEMMSFENQSIVPSKPSYDFSDRFGRPNQIPE